jgi:hypothetical protein
MLEGGEVERSTGRLAFQYGGRHLSTTMVSSLARVADSYPYPDGSGREGLVPVPDPNPWLKKEPH